MAASKIAGWSNRPPLHRSEEVGGLGFLLRLSRSIDLFNEKIGYSANLAVLFSCLISAGNAMVRYAFDYSSNGWLEIQWYL